ncbi:HMG-box domain-containing protein [Rhodotorula paludigena]|uniref:HMG-box domain-containing protein n=1 Tax=Rhodotorula paludigena TaxID=86838 RepID=UPI00317863CC
MHGDKVSRFGTVQQLQADNDITVPAPVPSAPPSPNGAARSDRPPRPMNAWLLFRTSQLRQMQHDQPDMRKSQGELSKIISEMWRNADPDVKQGYEDLAKQHKLEHQRMYPDYRYSPATKPKSSTRPKRTASTSSRSSRPDLRLSSSPNARSVSFDEGESAFFASGSASPASSRRPSPRLVQLPTPATATWRIEAGEWSPDLPVYSQDQQSQDPRLLCEPYTASHLPVAGGLPASAPATMASFSSSLGLTISQPMPADAHTAYDSTWQQDDLHYCPHISASASTNTGYFGSTQYLSPPATATYPLSTYDATAHYVSEYSTNQTAYLEPAWEGQVAAPAPALISPTAREHHHRASSGSTVLSRHSSVSYGESSRYENAVPPSSLYGVVAPQPQRPHMTRRATTSWEESTARGNSRSAVAGRERSPSHPHLTTLSTRSAPTQYASLPVACGPVAPPPSLPHFHSATYEQQFSQEDEVYYWARRTDQVVPVEAPDFSRHRHAASSLEYFDRSPSDCRPADSHHPHALH